MSRVGLVWRRPRVRRWEWGQEAPRFWSWAREVAQQGAPSRPHPGVKVSGITPCGAVEPWVGRPPPPPPVQPLPYAPLSSTPLLAAGCGLFSTRVPEIGTRTPSAGGSTPDRAWTRGCGAEGRRKPGTWRELGGRMEAKTDPPTPTSVGQSGKAGAVWAGWTLLVPAQRLPEPGCARQLPPLPRARGAQPAVGVGEEVLSEGCPAWSGSYLTGECGMEGEEGAAGARAGRTPDWAPGEGTGAAGSPRGLKLGSEAPEAWAEGGVPQTGVPGPSQGPRLMSLPSPKGDLGSGGSGLSSTSSPSICQEAGGPQGWGTPRAGP